MPIKRYKPAQIVAVVRQIEVEIANGMSRISCKQLRKWRAQGDDFRTFLADLVAGLPRLASLLARLPLWWPNVLRAR
jgi:hypothetical protein